MFASYEDDVVNNTAALPVTEQEEMDQWVVRWSQAVGLNLLPMFDLYSYPVTTSSRRELSGLVPFLPVDNITLKE